MMAFSVATVFAERYKRHKWVPYVAYTLATAISFSRISTGSHFPRTFSSAQPQVSRLRNLTCFATKFR